MANLPSFLRLDGLFELDQKGIDIRPTLLRVLTDQYIQSPRHTPEEEQQYTELAMRLIDETDIASRAAVATRLARHAAAPRAIILQLARDVLDVAESVLKYSPCLTAADCDAIISERGASYAELIAERGKVEQPAPIMTVSPELAPTLAGPGMEAEAEPMELCELFFAAGSSERQLILMTLDYAATEPRTPPASLQRADMWRLESAALAHNAPTVVREIERALGVSAALASRIVNDQRGEPVVVAAKAMMLPTDVLQRMLLFMNPAVGQSVDRVYELATLYGEISVEAARRLVAIWAEASFAEPTLQPSAEVSFERRELPHGRDVAESTRRPVAENSPRETEREALARSMAIAQANRGHR